MSIYPGIEAQGSDHLMRGGKGDDIYSIESEGDGVFEHQYDVEVNTVIIYIDYQLMPFIKNVLLLDIHSIKRIINELNCSIYDS